MANKYRFWSPIDKEWISGNLIELTHEGEFFHLYGEDFIPQLSLGEKDMTGKEIFEGDIVSVIADEHLFIVRFGKVRRTVLVADTMPVPANVDINGFHFYHLLSGNACFSIYNNRFGEHDLARTKVVGNIFENSDLIK